MTETVDLGLPSPSGDHADRAHALLSASGSHTWLECTPSIRFVESLNLVKVGDSPYAAEGTYCHEAGEAMLLHRLARISDTELLARLVEIRQKMASDPLMQMIGSEFDETMGDAAQLYADYVMGLAPNAESVDVEVRLDLTKWVPESFGTSDAGVTNLDEGILDVVDLKYGKGVKVMAEDNPQLMLYALGMLARMSREDLNKIKTVRWHIVQPRLGHISVAATTPRELLLWGRDFVKPRAAAAYVGEGEFKPSEGACRWCLAKPYCRARFDAVQDEIRSDFGDFDVEYNDDGEPESYEVSDLTDPAALARVFAKIAFYKAWLQDVEDTVNLMLRQGKEVPGYKLVGGRRSARKWNEKPEVIEGRLIEAGFTADDIRTEPALLSPAQMEKLLGKAKFSQLLSDTTIQEVTKPVVVPETDPRPSFTDEIGSDFA